ncbi:PepSY domain-containing protein [Breoghania sp. L-A4]|uniref:PepSY domain-containing protein n=1 Tax=Breoghania sp. L-A4 TaxID=2304600 RepID=UPI0013C2B355|nr:PepSY domain-containing protein [Breoghania sp. L-A4]
MRARSSSSKKKISGGLKAALLALALLLPCAAFGGLAYGSDDDHRLTPQERAIRLRDRGEILPLAEVIRRNGLDSIGRIIEVDLEEDHGSQVYELKILTSDSVVREYLIDPRTGRILGIE